MKKIIIAVLIIIASVVTSAGNIHAQNNFITTTTPNGGEILTSGGTITWTTANSFRNLTINIDLIAADGTSRAIATKIANTGSYQWNAPASIPSGYYKIQVSSIDNGPVAVDQSDGIFYFLAPSSIPTAVAWVTPTTVAANQIISMTAIASGFENLPLTYEWDFGDGSIGRALGDAGKTYTHVYGLPGTYQIILKVMNTDQVVTAEPVTVTLN